MNKNVKFIITVLSSCLLTSPISYLVNNYNVVKDENINLNNSFENKVLISKEMNREELIDYFLKSNNVSKAEAEKLLFKSKSILEESYLYSYIVLTKYINHGARIEFYIKGKASNNYYSIDTILNFSVKHNNYSFNGTLYTNLENNSTIYYDIEGNLLDIMNTSGSYNLGGYYSINIGERHSGNYIEHISDSGRVYTYYT